MIFGGTETLSYSLVMDLADVGGNVKDGVHIASMGGTWMAIVYGVAGLRDWGGRKGAEGKIRQALLEQDLLEVVDRLRT
jgi:trehalose/maltose hydrolase-like predicted phosphorylase